MKRPQAALFDALAEGEQLYVYPQESLDKLNAVILNKGRTLDVGCGDGAIPTAFDAPRVFGFDVSPRCARLSTKHGVPSIVADATQVLPFASSSFDSVYCVDVLHHLEGKQAPLLAELHRVLRPKGKLAIIEPDARNPFVRITQAPGSLLRVAPYNNEPAINPDEIMMLCLGAANRDERAYSSPDQFEIEKSKSPTARYGVAFGAGPHVCVGLQLARAEGVAVLKRILPLLQGVQLSKEAPPVRHFDLTFRGFDQLTLAKLF